MPLDPGYISENPRRCDVRHRKVRSGTIGLSHGDQTLNLKPVSTVKLEVEGKQEEHKESVSIKLK